MGIDPSSSCSGVAIVNEGKIEYSTHVVHSPDMPIQRNMNLFLKFLWKLQKESQVEGLVIERVSVSWNVNTIRKIAYFEAMGLLLAAQEAIYVSQVQATKARRIVLGRGTLSKEASFEVVKAKFPRWKFYSKAEPAMDEADAIVLALAGRELYEEDIAKRSA